jgi:hypothetical protein
MTNSKTPNDASTALENAVLNQRFPSLFTIGFIAALLLATAAMIATVVYFFMFISTMNNAINTTIKDYQDLHTLPSTATTGSMKPSEERNPDAFLSGILAARVSAAQVGIASCGILAGMSLAFLGFSLFLLGIKSEMGVQASTERSSAKITRMSPGVLAFVCSTIIIFVSASRNYNFGVGSPASGGGPTPYLQQFFSMPPSEVPLSKQTPGNERKPVPDGKK